MFRYKILFFLLVLSNIAFAQRTVYFKKGLIVNGVHHYGREAFYSDTLAYQLYSGILKKPVAGQTIAVNDKGDAITWREATADSANVFKSRGFGVGAYLYLTYAADKAETVLLNVKGNSAVYVNGVQHAGDPYSSGWLYIPVRLKKGENEFYIRTYSRTEARIIYPERSVMINTEDSTMPHVVLQKQNGILQGAVVIQNTTEKELNNYQIKAIAEGRTVATALPVVPALSTRKVIFNFDAAAINSVGKYNCSLILENNNKEVDSRKITLEAVDSTSKYSSTFVSNIDGSLQYYAVGPQTPSNDTTHALFLSVHGAGVEAIGQARAYESKDWGTLVAATNRRPRGFNWEDWGRLDALEVLNIAKEKFHPDPKHIYLTGHSMGGHGTWFLGATYPGNWAAIAPCSGYPTLKEYGSADGIIPDSSLSAAERMLLRASNQSDVVKLAANYKPFGVYILHGDSDKVVPVKYARQMKKVLSDFHPDYSYYEYPGGEHWFGNESVDWKPLFSYLKWHRLPEDTSVNVVDFTTASPGISSNYRWVSIQQQIHPLQYSRIQLVRSRSGRQITGSTENIRLLRLSLKDFGSNETVHIKLDSTGTVNYTTKNANDSIYLLKQNNTWVISIKPGTSQKNPARYGTFKDAFNNRMVFVYSTHGSNEENEWSLNKARFDAESWYYRGNGAVDIVADKDFSLNKYLGRGVVLYGNRNTNSIYNILLKVCPIQIERGKVAAGNKSWSGEDFAAYFIWPIAGSSNASVAVIGGSGLKGMKAANANQYFAGGSGFPDFMIFNLDMLNNGVKDLKMVGFYNNDWKLDDNEMVQEK